MTINPTSKLIGPYWPESVRVIARTVSAYGDITVEAVGLETGQHYTTTLPPEQWEKLPPVETLSLTFRADPQQFRLALEAQRLKLAYSCDPLLAINNSLIHLLPHQVEAVYETMLPQPAIRHLLAHDAGAGKTVMAGLLYRELASRQPGLRTLIVAPASLAVQWQRELAEKFLAHFDVVGRGELREDPNVWMNRSQCITSVHFARQADVQTSLSNVPWDLVIVDEAHHLAAYEKHSTQAYRLGQILSRQTRHLVLATATPHKGDPENFLKLLQLLEPGTYDPTIVRHSGNGRGSPLMLRRLKEEMVDFDGNPLFLPREVVTRWHTIGDNPPEMELYIALTEYVNKTYRAAERAGGREQVNVQFAMTILQRRMGSSFAALKRSLVRRRDSLLKSDRASPEAEIPDEDLPEHERWQIEDRIETASAAKSKQAREKEASEIDSLLSKLDAVRQTGIETKVVKLREILAEAGVAPGNGEKLLVFTEFKDTLDFLRGLFEAWGYRVTQIDGSMPHDLRRRAEREFRDKAQVMVATEAAGEGINLQFCARMVNYDLPWVPTRLEQRMGRIHRYGQKRVAKIYNVAAGDTREGKVLTGLLDRLDEMREHLGDQVFDVISTLIGDTNPEQLLAQVALSPLTEDSQTEALAKLIAATEAGEERFKQWQDHPFPIDPEKFQEMRAASREFRLTPEYAQDFWVNALRQFKENPVSIDGGNIPPEDAGIVGVTLHRRSVAEALRLATEHPLRYTFRSDVRDADSDIRFVGLGANLFDGMIRLAEEHWGKTLDEGAIFLDPSLPPGEAYLLWFLKACVIDGSASTVRETLFAVRQTPQSLAPASASALVDVFPEQGAALVPPALQGLVADPQVVINWSVHHQQLPDLIHTQAFRARIVALRREPILADARAALHAAQNAYNELAFGMEEGIHEMEQKVEDAKQRLKAQQTRFEREAACALGAPSVVGVVAVLSPAGAPQADLTDQKPEIAQTAQALVRQYEEAHARAVVDVSGEHRDYPYDLHSTGPGGPRCIEVKGTTTGRIILSENERRAARRFGPSYYLYIVRDPLKTPRLTIIRDPLSRMQYDDILYSGVRYAFNSKTWQAAADEEIVL